MAETRNERQNSAPQSGMGRGPGRGPGRGAALAGPPKVTKANLKTLGRVLSYIRGEYAVRFGLVLLFILLNTLASTAGSLFLRTLIDDYIKPLLLESAPVYTGLLTAILTMACIYAVGIASTYLYNRIMVTISQGVLKEIRIDMFKKMQALPIRYFDTHTYGETMSRFTNDTDTLRQLIGQSIPQLCSTIVTIVVVFVNMVRLSWLLTLFVLAFIAVMMVITAKIGMRSSGYFVKQQKALGSINGFVEEMINGQKVIKVFCREPQTREEFDVRNEELCKNATAANMLGNILWPIMGGMSNVQYVLLAILGGALAINGIGGLTLGTIVAFLQLARSFTMPINQISQQINAVVMAMAGADRIFDLMDSLPEADEGVVTLVNARIAEDGSITEVPEHTGVWAWKDPQEDGTVRYTKLEGDVRFFDVDFAYVPEKPVLHDISLYAKPGQKVAFVGATGAGKTTITNLINRFYDIADGKIRYDGININRIKKADLRRSLGIVLQDVNLFTGTVMDNIRYGNLNATDEACIEAAKRANAHGFISMLPDGYNTMLSTGDSGLSQGQRQLLSIARAAVADPPVMILDEATSSIDTRTEAIVQRGMDQLMHGRTVFVIAHRLSTVQNSEVIIVLEHGHIIERGTHAQLIEQQGKYYQLYTGAFELS